MLEKSPEQIRAALLTAKSVKAAAEFLNIPRTTLRRRIAADPELSSLVKEKTLSKVTYPEIPKDKLSAKELWDHHEKKFLKMQARQKALKWFNINIDTDKPIGLAFVGDPHLGSSGCNIPLLRRDMGLLGQTEDLFAINIGDTVDNWPSTGRLLAQYSESDVSRSTERILAEYFLKDSGVNWLLWLLGNHDTMGDAFSVYMKEIAKNMMPMIDWRAQFKITFANGKEVKVDAAHNHKGHSMWNELHGQERAAVLEEPADIYIAGHHHTWAMKRKEMPDGRVVDLARCRGYKFVDSYASKLQFSSQNHGATILFVIDPKEGSNASIITPFADLDTGVNYLNYLRDR